MLEHRVILFDSIGLGPHWCCHCGRHVNWGMKGSDRLVVDHLNFDPYDNDLDNLGQSCQRCNAARSCALEFEP